MTAFTARRSIHCMVRVSVFLAVLLVVLTFNAYACVLPLPQSAEMDCSSGMGEPARGTCDAFLELGPQSQVSWTNPIFTSNLECALPVPLLPETFIPLVRITTPPRNTDAPIHRSIHTTVLRI